MAPGDVRLDDEQAGFFFSNIHWQLKNRMSDKASRDPAYLMISQPYP